MKGAMIVTVGLSLIAAGLAAGGPPKSQEDLKREAAIDEFTQRMKFYNYPALFDQAAREFNVPADILRGVAFAETRWEHLQWPPGETRSPENGMPRPFGIMSLWDNEIFGHSLLEAAALIGKTPEELKADACQNMRGGAALLRRIYDETPKPAGTTEADIESWRYAIRKYCGIPEPDLNARHALDVYVFMSQGYHQYGIEWDAHPVNLEPMRQDTQRIVAEEKAKREARQPAVSDSAARPPRHEAGAGSGQPKEARDAAGQPGTTRPAAAPVAASASFDGWWLVGLGGVLGVLAVVAALGRNRARQRP